MLQINHTQSRGGFLIRRNSAIRRFFAGFLRCDNRTIMKSFLKEIAREFSGNFVGFLCKFPVYSRAIFWGNDFIIVRLSHFRNPANPANRRAASDEKPTPGVLGYGYMPTNSYSYKMNHENSDHTFIFQKKCSCVSCATCCHLNVYHI